jgi:hypothetical protein
MSKLFDALSSLEARESGGQEAIHYLTEKREDRGRRKVPVWTLPLLVFLFFAAAGLGFILSLSSFKIGHTGRAAGFDLRQQQAKTDRTAPTTIPAMPTTMIDNREPLKIHDELLEIPNKDLKDNAPSGAKQIAAQDLIKMHEAGHFTPKPGPDTAYKEKNGPEQDRLEKIRPEKARENISNGGHELALPPSHEFVKDEPGLITREHLLQQAEEYRAAGRMEEAAGLYRTVWAKTGDPGVANNLAAALLVLGRAKEAEGVLSEALKKAPDDVDLKFNLDLARRKLAQAVRDR